MKTPNQVSWDDIYKKLENKIDKLKLEVAIISYAVGKTSMKKTTEAIAKLSKGRKEG